MIKMNYTSLFPAIICILCVFRISDGKTTVTPKVPVSRKPSTNFQSLPNRTKIITTRFGADGVTPEKQCQCTLFYLCNNENTVPLSSGQSCEENYVCCSVIEILTGSIDNTNNNGGGGNTNINNNSNGSITGGNGGGSNIGGFNTTGSGDDGNVPSGGNVNHVNRPSTNADCICISPNQCDRDPDEASSGAGLLDIKQTPCTISEICCPVSKVINTSGTSGNGGEGGSNNTGGTDGFEGNGSGSTGPVVGPGGTEGSSGTDEFLCGIRNTDVNTRIVTHDNTRQTTFGEFPWMALLLKPETSQDGTGIENIFVCGASLLSASIVLTAAHCVNDISINTLKVRAGEYDTKLDAEREPKPHQERTVSQIIQHPNFHPKALHNDLALVVVSEPFVFDTHIIPICIPTLNVAGPFDTNAYDPRNCIATGWGKSAFAEESSYPEVLKKVDLSLVSNDLCQQQLRHTRLGPAFILDPSFICAGGQSGKDTCEGDGGGPLVCAQTNNANRYVQVGIVAWGIGCGNEIPSVYASISANLDWLYVQFSSISVGISPGTRFGSAQNATKPGVSGAYEKGRKPLPNNKPVVAEKLNASNQFTVKPGRNVSST